MTHVHAFGEEAVEGVVVLCQVLAGGAGNRGKYTIPRPFPFARRDVGIYPRECVAEPPL